MSISVICYSNSDLHIYHAAIINLPFCLVYSVRPTITAELMDQTQNETFTVFFTCQSDGEPLPTISWYFNGAALDVSDTVKYLITTPSTVDATIVRSTLLIRNVQSSDVGTYTCNATNLVANDTSSGVLTVNGEL